MHHIKLSRSHVETYFDCPRKFWLRYYAGGTGYDSAPTDAQSIGTLTHGYMEAVLAGRAPAIGPTFQERLAGALALGWRDVRLPRYHELYETIAVEQEVEIPLSDTVTLMSRVDVVSRRRSDGAVFAGPEWKTTSMLTPRWVESWRYSSQTLSHTLDVEFSTGQEAAGVLMEFMYKGRKNNKGDHVSVLLPQDDRPVEQWIAQVPMEQKAACYQGSEVWRSPAELEQWKATVVWLGEFAVTVAAAVESDVGAQRYYRPRLDQFCYSNKYGYACEFLGVCYGEIEDPLASGLFVPRVPHHPGEFAA